MEITFKKTVQVKNLEQWFNCAPPEGGMKQWKPGRSAMEMARFALSERFPAFISEIAKGIGCKEKHFDCEPEALTPFNKDMGKSGPRHHDLLLVGKNLVIGVEAKVSEPYDSKISEKRKKAESENNNNMICRLDSCLSYLYGTNLPKNVEDLYYQLFSATIGTILAAKNNHKTKALVLFITFTGDVEKERYYNKHIQDNEDAFKAFCNSLGLGDEGGKIPNVPGDPQIECWIKSVKINIGNYSF